MSKITPSQSAIDAASMIAPANVPDAYDAINPANIRINKPYRIETAKKWLSAMGQESLYERLIERAETIQKMESAFDHSQNQTDEFAAQCESMNQYLESSVPVELLELREALYQRM